MTRGIWPSLSDMLGPISDLTPYVLTGNADGSEWTTPIGSYHDIDFDGAGFTIYGLEEPLFGALTNSKIYNLNVETDMPVTEGNFGSVVCSGTNVTLEDITVSGTMTTEYSMVGGIAGNLSASLISRCESNMAITMVMDHYNVNNIGGIIGLADTCEIHQCTNKGDLVAEASGPSYTCSIVGGIAGSFSGMIADCVNEGVIDASLASKNVSIGGICGNISGATVIGNVNKGNVSGGYTAGGIVGSASTPSLECLTMNVNSGNVSAAQAYSAQGGCGGIIGMGRNCVISDNHSCGILSTIPTGPNTLDTLFGGIVGFINSGIINVILRGNLAANLEINTETDEVAHRIIGGIDSGALVTATIENNFALDTMLLNGVPVSTPSDEDGEDISCGELKTRTPPLFCDAECTIPILQQNRVALRQKGPVISRNAMRARALAMPRITVEKQDFDDSGMPRIELNEISLDRAFRNIVASIALQEAAIAHVLNAEGEKLQRIIGIEDVDVDMLVSVNESVTGLTGAVADIEESLARKLSNSLFMLGVSPGPITPPIPPGLAKFTVHTKVPNTDLPVGAKYSLTSTTRTGETIVGESGPNYGDVTFEDVPPGTYLLTEPVPLIGFKGIGEYTVFVDKEGNATIEPGAPPETSPKPADGYVIYQERDLRDIVSCQE